MKFLFSCFVLFCSGSQTSAQLFPELGYNLLFPLEVWILFFFLICVSLICLAIIWIAFCHSIYGNNRTYKEYIKAIRRNRNRNRQTNRRVQQWRQTPETPAPDSSRRHRHSHEGGHEIRLHSDGSSVGVPPTREPPKAIPTREPPKAITFRRDKAEPRQLYVSVSLLQSLVARQQINSMAAMGAQPAPSYPLGPFAEPDPPSYNEIMGRNFPEVHDEAEEIEMSNWSAQAY